jgi:hypothetical protein
LFALVFFALRRRPRRAAQPRHVHPYVFLG